MSKILVIEDDKMIRDSLVELLEAEGFEVAKAENGSIGVGLARKVKPDLVICDIMMPQLDGYSVLAELQQEPGTASIPFIFLTAKTDKGDMRQGMNLGADDYLTKPFSREEVLEAINSRLTKQANLLQHSQQPLNVSTLNLTKSLPHEFATPLSAIIGFSDLLLSEYPHLKQEQVIELAEQLQTNARRLHSLIQNFLLYAEVELIALNPDRLKLLAQSQSGPTKEFISGLARQKAAVFKREADLELGLQEASIQMEQDKLARVIEELVDNAFQFSLRGTPVRLMGLIKEKKYILYITDSGKGMTTEQVANFGSYMQFEHRIQQQQGAGLSLTIAKRLIELYQGTLNVESIMGQKTILRIELPLASGSPG